MFRFSLAGLLFLVLWAALGCAALVQGGDAWRQTMVTATVSLLLGATLAAIVWRGTRRIAAAGFALFGWVYLILSFVSVLELRSDLLTEKAVSALYQVVHGRDNAASADQVWQSLSYSADGKLLVAGAGGEVRLFDVATGIPIAGSGRGSVAYDDFADMAHALWAVLVACLGGILARGLAGLPDRQTRADANAPVVGDDVAGE